VIYVSFARLTFVKLKPDVSLEDTRKIWDGSVVPAAKEQKGFIGGFLLVTEQRDEAVAVTLWESKDEALAGEQSSYFQDQVKKFAAFMAAPPDRKHYDVNSEIVFVKELGAGVASLTITKAKPDISIDEVRKVWDENVIPAIKNQKGYIGGFLLASEKRDQAISVALWESKDDAVAIQKSGLYQEQLKKFMPFIESIEDRKFYDVNSEIVFLKELEAL